MIPIQLFTFILSSLCFSDTSSAADLSPLHTNNHYIQPQDLGLTNDKIQKSGIYVGVLPDWSNESPLQVNQRLGASAAVIGDYVNITPQNLNLSQMEWHWDAMNAVPAGTIYSPAVIPSQGLADGKWTSSMRDALVAKCLKYNQHGITVWLRFAYEMNGDWFAYGYAPEPHIAAFRDLADAIHANTKNTFMLWSPNIYDAKDALNTNQVMGYEAYYPGAEYVDIAGLSIYSRGNGNVQNTVTPDGAFFKEFSTFHDRYGPSHPIVISETAAYYHYDLPSELAGFPSDSEIPSKSFQNLTSLTPSSGDATEVDIKGTWAEQLLAMETKARFPNLTAVSFFNYIKTAGASAQQLSDHRIVHGNPDVENWHRNFFANQTAYYLGYTSAGQSISPSFTIAVWILVILTLNR